MVKFGVLLEDAADRGTCRQAQSKSHAAFKEKVSCRNMNAKFAAISMIPPRAIRTTTSPPIPLLRTCLLIGFVPSAVRTKVSLSRQIEVSAAFVKFK
jgi:hypothetical protein